MNISITDVLRLEWRQANGHPGLVAFLIRPARRPGRVEVSANLWPVGIDGAVDAATKLAHESRATRVRLVCALHDEAKAAEPLGPFDGHPAPCDIVSLGPIE